MYMESCPASERAAGAQVAPHGETPSEIDGGDRSPDWTLPEREYTQASVHYRDRKLRDHKALCEGPTLQLERIRPIRSVPFWLNPPPALEGFRPVWWKGVTPRVGAAGPPQSLYRAAGNISEGGTYAPAHPCGGAGYRSGAPGRLFASWVKVPYCKAAPRYVTFTPYHLRCFRPTLRGWSFSFLNLFTQLVLCVFSFLIY
jgi:hypothetical protein